MSALAKVALVTASLFLAFDSSPALAMPMSLMGGWCQGDDFYVYEWDWEAETFYIRVEEGRCSNGRDPDSGWIPGGVQCETYVSPEHFYCQCRLAGNSGPPYPPVHWSCPGHGVPGWDDKDSDAGLLGEPEPTSGPRLEDGTLLAFDTSTWKVSPPPTLVVDDPKAPTSEVFAGFLEAWLDWATRELVEDADFRAALGSDLDANR